MRTLHYPDYMLLILGPCKLLAVVALLYPKTRVLREWAYAGVMIDSMGAFALHCAVHFDPCLRAGPSALGSPVLIQSLRCKNPSSF
jgi:hypothetical protein